jgi:hypothetical protein
MYNSTTRSYTLEDASGSYNWIVKNCDRADFQGSTDQEIIEWAEREIATAKENAIYALENKLEGMTFPRMGYTTAQTFEDIDEYEAFKRAEIESDLNGELEYLIKFLKSWIAGE